MEKQKTNRVGLRWDVIT